MVRLIDDNGIDEQPTVYAEPVRHGKWIDIDSQMYTWKVRCDQCGHERSMMSTQGRYPRYCENCAAKMDDKEEDLTAVGTASQWIPCGERLPEKRGIISARLRNRIG